MLSVLAFVVFGDAWSKAPIVTTVVVASLFLPSRFGRIRVGIWVAYCLLTLMARFTPIDLVF
jgi:hypothetical protein